MRKVVLGCFLALSVVLVFLVPAAQWTEEQMVISKVPVGILENTRAFLPGSNAQPALAVPFGLVDNELRAVFAINLNPSERPHTSFATLADDSPPITSFAHRVYMPAEEQTTAVTMQRDRGARYNLRC
ncbi:MAG TPA: hypothetical protein VGC58_00330 [Candidatus Paceibacterota bacterium]